MGTNALVSETTNKSTVFVLALRFVIAHNLILSQPVPPNLIGSISSIFGSVNHLLNNTSLNVSVKLQTNSPPMTNASVSLPFSIGLAPLKLLTATSSKEFVIIVYRCVPVV